MKTAIVSGATGFLGRNTVSSLLDHGYRVYALCKEGKEALGPIGERANLIVVPSTFDDIEALPRLIPNADLFVHIAWAGVNRTDLDNPEIQKANVDASLRYLSILGELGVKFFVDYGSRAEYGDLVGLLSEDMECRPQNAYGKCKLEFYNRAKDFCSAHNIQYVHFRFFSIFGLGDHPWSLMSSLGEKLPKGDPVDLGPCNQKWNLISIEDAMAYIVAVFDGMERGTIPSGIALNIASKDTRLLKDYILSANALCGNKSNLKFGSFTPMKGSTDDVIPDVRRLRSLVRVEEQGFEKGFLRMIKGEIK